LEFEESDRVVDRVAKGVTKKRIRKETSGGNVRGEERNGKVAKSAGKLEKGKECMVSKKTKGVKGRHEEGKGGRSGAKERTHRGGGTPTAVQNEDEGENSYAETENEGPIRITSQTLVDHISRFKEPLTRYPVGLSEESIGYLFDLGEYEPALSHPTYSMDKILRSAVCFTPSACLELSSSSNSCYIGHG
jgi:hypothetical protein